MSKSPMSAPLKSDFVHKLKALLIANGWNASELARRATMKLPKFGSRKKISRQDVSKYLTGVVAPSPLTLKAMADALNVTPESLLSSAAMPVIRLPKDVAQGNARPPSMHPIVPAKGQSAKVVPAVPGKAETASVTQTDSGMAWVSINQAVPWPKALEIMRLLKGNK